MNKVLARAQVKVRAARV